MKMQFKLLNLLLKFGGMKGEVKSNGVKRTCTCYTFQGQALHLSILIHKKTHPYCKSYNLYLSKHSNVKVFFMSNLIPIIKIYQKKAY